MNIDIIDVFRFHSCIFKGIVHYQFCAQSFRMRSSQVVSVSRHSAATYFSIDVSSTSQCMFQFFENETCSTFTHYETIARAAERTRSVLWIVVASRKSVHRIETAYTCRIDSCFSTTGDDCVSLAKTNQVECVDQGVSR